MDKTTDLPRAVQIFSLDEGRPASPIAKRVWRTRSVPIDAFTSVAATHWQMVVMKHQGRTSLTVRGPETTATTVPIPQDTDFLGVEFRLGTFMPNLPVGRLVDRDLTLPDAGTRTFWLNGSAWEFPTFDNVDVFLRRLTQRGLVVYDPLVEAARQGRHAHLSSRSMRRRILHATGLTLGLIRQIDRAGQALRLLEDGATILDVVAQTGYADQPHLTRSLHRFLGHTPGRIVRDQPR
jgi:AraC-like DNA-binding protein